MKKLINSWIPKVLAVAMVFAAVGMQATPAFALSLTSMSDIMSRLEGGTASDHEIKFATPALGGIATGETVILTFTGFSSATVNAIDDTDVDIATGDSSTCSSATYSEQTVGATNGAAQWGVTAGSGAITIVAPSSGTPLAADRCLRVKIGQNATGGVANEQITNGSDATSHSIAITGTFGDTGTIAVDILADDQVVVTATVGPSISFAISDNTIGFGALSIAAAQYADGTGAGSASDTIAHTLAASTNASSGYVITMFGPTLTSGGNTITAIGGANTASAPGTEQFGVRFDETGSGSGTVTAPYAASGFAYDATAAPDQIASASGATDTSTYSAHYVANIDINTEAGAYDTTLTYTATATF